MLDFDKYVGYTPGELLIPFASHSHPVLTGAGTLSFYTALALILSSDVIKHIGKEVWRAIHFLAYPGFIMGFIHGYFLGSDTQYQWVQGLYWVTSVMVLVLTERLFFLIKCWLASYAREVVNSSVPGVMGYESIGF